MVEDDPGRGGPGQSRRQAEALGAVVIAGPSAATLVGLVAEADLVVPSPGVPVAHPVYDLADRAGTPVVSEIELAGRLTTAPVVAVTGTNGKTTVTTMITEILVASGVAAVAAGNIGRPLLDAAGAPDPPEVLVAEVSSFQLQFTAEFRPCVAVMLNLAADHLDWHPSFAHYRAAKARIFARQRGDDVLVVNAADPAAASMADEAAAVVQRFAPDGGPGEFRVEDGNLVTAGGDVIVAVGDLARAHPHDLANALAASAAALSIPTSQRRAATVAATGAALRAHRSLPHRLSLVGEAGGVRWYDDSKATNPSAALAAVEGFDSAVLLAGGRNKGLDLGILASAAPRLRSVIAFGESGGEVEAAFAGVRPVVRVGSMREAVAAAGEAAEPGDAVLLSPACASFDDYPDYAARGDDFSTEVARWISGRASGG